MLALKIVLGILLFLLLLLLLPLRVHAAFDGELRMRVGYGPVLITVYPAKENKKKPAKSSKKSRKKAAGRKRDDPGKLSQILKEDGVTAVVGYLKNIAAIVAESARRVAHIAVIDQLRLDIRVVGEDAAQTATDYGKVCAVVYPALSLIESAFRVKKNDIRIAPDFLMVKGSVRFDIRVHAMGLRILMLIPRLIWRLIAHNSDDGAQNDAPPDQRGGNNETVKTGKEG